MENKLQQYLTEKKLNPEKLPAQIKENIEAYNTAYDQIQPLPEFSSARMKVEHLLDAYLPEIKAMIEEKADDERKRLELIAKAKQQELELIAKLKD